jgi:hypothetical protein
MDLQWGSVPDWFGAVGTVGALLLGLSILSRDKRKAERAEADEFICRLDARHTDVPHAAPAWSGKLYAKNIGRWPVYDVVLFFPTLSESRKPRQGTHWLAWAIFRSDRLGKGSVQGLQRAVANLHGAALGYNLVALPSDAGAPDDVRSVLPGQSISVIVDVADGNLLDPRGWLLRFTDSHGRRWVRELAASRLISRRKTDRIIRPLMGTELKFTVHNPPGSGVGAR